MKNIWLDKKQKKDKELFELLYQFTTFVAINEPWTEAELKETVYDFMRVYYKVKHDSHK